MWSRTSRISFPVSFISLRFLSFPYVENLVKLVEDTIRFENDKFPDIPLYLVGESIGGCLALAAAGGTPHIDLVLVLANPG
ncbi:acyltransferase-like protein, chloroplastic [Tanacetum coccineum]